VNDYARLLTNAETLAAVIAGKGFDEINSMWEKDLSEFRERRAKALLYFDGK
jgi:hypothetical protein